MEESKVVVITGASTGLGEVLARHYAAAGWRVVANYLFEDGAAALANEILDTRNGPNALLCKADVSKRDQVRRMFDEAIETFGRVDVLINCAGVNKDAPFTDITDEAWDTVIGAHLKGHFICGQEFVLHNPSNEGVIINLGAACGQAGRRNGANFCSAKGGIISLTKCMALELAPRIRVNCLIPGSVGTREVIERYHLETEQGLQKELSTLPMQRLGAFEDVTHMVDAIVGAKFTTGACFYVNGGQYMH